MPRVVIELDTDNAKSYCQRVADWIRQFPVCRSCKKDGEGSFRYVRESSKCTEKTRSLQATTTPISVIGLNHDDQKRGYTNPSFIETGEHFIFDLATPATVKNNVNPTPLADVHNIGNAVGIPVPDVVPQNHFPYHQDSRSSSASIAPVKRSDVKFNKSLGRGWFGWIVEGQLRKTNLATGAESFESVVAQILREEASENEQQRFLAETRTGQIKQNPNVLSLVASITDSQPLLHLYESCPLGNLKTYLMERRDDASLLQEEGLIIKFCTQITNGVASLHEAGIVPTDLALRTCQLTVDMNVKVGDYGLAPMVFLEDYVPLNGNNQPIRWMPPEVLAVMDRSGSVASDATNDDSSLDDDDEDDDNFVSASEIAWTGKNGVWSLAVTLWEVTALGDQPFQSISDNQFVRAMLTQPLTVTAQLGKMRIWGVDAENIQSVINLCFKLAPESRPDCSRLATYLQDYYECKMEEKQRKLSQNLMDL